jgi:ATP-dependent Clp protease ATP-binding subunit ClpC
MKTKVTDELKRTFRPEFLNRIDEVIVFHALEEKHISKIVTLMADDIHERLKEQGIDFTLSEEAKNHIAKVGFDPQYGARPLRRALQKQIEDRLSEELLRGSIKKGDNVLIDLRDNEIVVDKVGTTI